MAKNKFYKFTNIIDNNKDLYVYGVIIGGADKWDESDVTFTDFKNTLEQMSKGSILNMYINSPGGDVFTTQSSIAMIRRAKDRGVKINAYIDGLAASCGSWLPMIADEIFIYPQSIMMIHKPLCMVYGNSDEMQKEIEVLDKIENDVIIPLYMEKAKDGITEDILREKMSNESWLNANEIQEIFNVTLLEDERKIACCVDKEVFNKYSNVPDELLKIANEVSSEEPEDEENNNSKGNKTETDGLENKISSLKEEVKILSNERDILVEEKNEVAIKLNEANEKIIALNKEITLMKPLVDDYNKLQDEKKAKEEEKALEDLMKDYESKFNMINASKKFKSEEVQSLIKDAVKDESKKNDLNSMIVDLIQINNNKLNKKISIDNSTDMNNLIQIEKNGATKYGFK
ncbi:head maturation protease, ClpP-related [Clostridium sardiniense]|uniref:head maturation protease, ClpP-related n=1 Tax=Clostridium sardiniense TaxID=29369 RepID=UPI001FAF582B|nr:head maturation protease, ClpP-related [Clostridium sardiniense]MBM7835743.1 ATP-dependent protease ClpP protease subunit [Clostridium sardiniense]